MFHPVYLIFRVRSRWGKPSEEFLILLIQICLWFRETNTQSWGRGGGGDQFPRYVHPATKATAPVV